MEISKNIRVWIYQSNRTLTIAEQAQITTELKDFTTDWMAHEHKLIASAEIKHDLFIIFEVDEGHVGASGCSIDKSVQLIKHFESKYGITLFDRFNIAYVENNTVKSCTHQEFETLIAKGIITPETIVFNNMVQTKNELETNWKIPFKDSWHAKIFGNLIPS